MACYAAVPGFKLEPLGSSWAVFSPLSGETHILNDESATILEWLRDQGPAGADQIAPVLAVEAGMPEAKVRQAIEFAWVPLLVAGLVRRLPVAAVASPRL